MPGLLPPQAAEGVLVVGELSRVRACAARAASCDGRHGLQGRFPAPGGAEGGGGRGGPDPRVGGDPGGLHARLIGGHPIAPQPYTEPDEAPPPVPADFRGVRGQKHVKRALEGAAAGGHNVLMIDVPGAGKTLRTRALPGRLPHLSIDETLDMKRVYSIADQQPPETPMIRPRPFRAPHHTLSYAGLAGGGNWSHPGEISLAPCGVLFLEELPACW